MNAVKVTKGKKTFRITQVERCYDTYTGNIRLSVTCDTRKDK